MNRRDIEILFKKYRKKETKITDKKTDITYCLKITIYTIA